MDKLKHPIDLDCITPEQAIQGTIEMWSDMLDELGNRPSIGMRNAFKEYWLNEHGYESTYPGITRVNGNCFLCECAGLMWRKSGYSHMRCDHCPIYWPNDEAKLSSRCASDSIDYLKSPIPIILAYLKDENNRRSNDKGTEN